MARQDTQRGYNLCKYGGCGTITMRIMFKAPRWPRSVLASTVLQYSNSRFVAVLWSAQLAACVQLQTHKFPFPFDTWQPIKLVKKYSNKGHQPLGGQRLGLRLGQRLRLWLWLRLRMGPGDGRAKKKSPENTKTVFKMVKSASQYRRVAHKRRGFPF